MYLNQQLKDSLKSTLSVTAIRMQVQSIQPFTNQFKKFIFKGSRWQLEEKNIKSLCTTFTEPYPEDLLQFVLENKCVLFQKEVTIGYNDLSYNEVLEALLPKNVAPPQGYEMIGRIAHFNLAPDQLPYKYLIGQVLLEKNKHLETVCNKTEKLHNVYRTPQLELLAGKHCYDAVVPEGGVKLHLNFEEVYWCTRLYSERERIINFIKTLTKSHLILDLFCGIGPFSLRAAKDLGAVCMANDLNPQCFKFLQQNIAENQLHHLVTPLNMDAREVVLKIYNKELDFSFNHVYMNLPVLAIDFLDVFKGFTHKTQRLDLPYIHVYGFAKGRDDEQLINEFTDRIIRCLPGFKKESILKFHVLKNVTKLKKMCCLSFQLDQVSAESEFELLQNNDARESDLEDDGRNEDEIDEQIDPIPNKKVKLQ